MKKLIKTLALAFVAIATVSVFSSCTKEDDEDDYYHPSNSKESDFDPYYDEVQHIEVGDLTLRGDSVFADVTLYYTKFGGSSVQKLSEPQFVGRNVCRIKGHEIKSFRLRNDSIFRVTVTKTNCYDYMTSKDSITDAISERYIRSKCYHPNISYYKYGCVITQNEEEQESFVTVVNDPFERWYNSYINGEEFAFVYTTHLEYEGASNYTETYYGHISPKKLVRQGEKFATLEIVNY